MSRVQRILIVDDEAPAAQRLVRMLDGMEAVEVCGAVTDAASVVASCREQLPDVVLLDVEMPGLSGIDLARQLGSLSPSPAVVFVTAFEQYAVEAFDLAAVDYLVKPVRPERLERALERARMPPRTRRASLQTRLGDRVLNIAVSEIRALVAEDKYTVVHSPDGEALVEDSLVSLEQRFPGVFLRVHRKALVSRRHVRGIHRDADGQERVDIEGTDYCPPISRRNLPQVRQQLKGEG